MWSTVHFIRKVLVPRKRVQVLDVEHEDMFWEKKLLGYSSPQTLQNTFFLYVGLHFALRGVQEQYDLVPQQFSRFTPDVTRYNSTVYYEFTEFVSNTD